MSTQQHTQHSARGTTTNVRLIIASVVCLAVLTGVGVLVYIISSHMQATQQLAADLDREVAREAQLRSIEKLVGDVSDERAAIEAQFVSAENVVSFIDRVEALNRDIAADIAISSVTEQQPSADGIGSISMQLRVAGSWQSVLQAIALIETLPVATRLGSVSLTGSENGWVSNFTITTLTRTTQ